VQTFIARQPIFDQHQKAYAYELLYRSGQQNNFCDHVDLNQASSKVIADCCSLLGTENITSGKKAFINVTRNVLLNEYINLLPKDLTVVELLETIEPEPEVIAACQRLKEAGYLLALDDFVYDDRYQPLVEMADIIKVDFLATGKQEQAALVKKFGHRGIRFLAEKVETREVFQEAVEMGYSYFQGYFFCKPVILSKKDVPGFKLNYLRILQEINRPELDFDEVEEIIKQDMSLYYKFLRYINSAAFGWRREIESIRQALMLMGENQFKKWASLITLASMGQGKPEELVVQAIIRGKFCESLAPSINLSGRAEEFFLMGMLSLIDVIMDRSLAEILREIPIANDVKDALLGKANDLHGIYQYILAYERGEWESLAKQVANLGIDDSDTPQLYLEAVEWVQQSLRRGALTN